jgi:hypothetical protein
VVTESLNGLKDAPQTTSCDLAISLLNALGLASFRRVCRYASLAATFVVNGSCA